MTFDNNRQGGNAGNNQDDKKQRQNTNQAQNSGRDRSYGSNDANWYGADDDQKRSGNPNSM